MPSVCQSGSIGILFSTSLKALQRSSGSKKGSWPANLVPIPPENRNLTQLWGYDKIIRSAKYAHFGDFSKRSTYGTSFSLIGAHIKPGLTSAHYQVFLKTFTARTLPYLSRDSFHPALVASLRSPGGSPVCRRVSFVLVAWTSKVTVRRSSAGKSLLIP